MPRILVIEDEQIVRNVICNELAEAGFAVSSTPDGPAGLASARDEMPDAVVLDLRLPRMDGREVLRHLKGLNSNLPVFVFSARGDFPEALAGVEGADRCFAKSADLRPLIQAIGLALR